MKFKYIVVCCWGDLPFGTNSRKVAMSYTTTEDHYVIDTEENTVIHSEIESEDLLEVPEPPTDLDVEEDAEEE